MNKFVVFITLISASCTLSAPNTLRSLPALKHEHLQDEYGQYALRYVTAEGTIVSEKGRLIPNLDGKGHVMVMEGEVTYIGDDGKTYVTKYSAGLDGVKVEGDHLPVAPEPPVETSVTPLPSVEAVSVETTTSAVVIPEAPTVPPVSTVAP